jgi:hypothetical protein
MNYQIITVRRLPAEKKVEFELVGEKDLTYTAVFDGADNSFKVTISMFRQANPYSRKVAGRFKKVRAEIAERLLRWLEVHGVNMSDEARAAGGYEDPCEEICFRLSGGPLEGVMPEGTMRFPIKTPVVPVVRKVVVPPPAEAPSVVPPPAEVTPVEAILNQPVFPPSPEEPLPETFDEEGVEVDEDQQPEEDSQAEDPEVTEEEGFEDDQDIIPQRMV